MKTQNELKEIIESLLPLCFKTHGAAIVCQHCGTIFLPHDLDCPVRLAEHALVDMEE